MVVLPAPEGEERTNNTPRRFRWTFSAMEANCARDGGGQGPRGQGTMVLGISRGGWLVAAGLMLLLTAILLAMGRPPICPCGAIGLWHGTVQSDQNSQQISDWYSFSHIIHGFIFLGLSRWLMPKREVWEALAVAIGIEEIGRASCRERGCQCV